MNYPVWQLTATGGGFWMILIAVFHVYIAHFAVGGGLFLVLIERKGYRENNQGMLAYARAHARFFLLLTMVAGSITGVGIWFIISLLNPAATSLLIHTFVFGWASEWVCFLVEIISLFIYAYTFHRMDARRHQWFGWIYFAAAWMSLFFINGIIAFMLTPGSWIVNHNFWSGFFNPTFWPSLFFRTFLSFLIAGLFGLVTATWIKELPLRKQMVRFCSWWLLLPLLLMLATAAWYQTALPPEIQERMLAHMPSVRRALHLFLLCSVIVLFSALLFAIRMPARLTRPLALLLLLIGQLYIGSFEFIREGARRPYIISDYMYANAILKKDRQSTQSKGILSQAKWVDNRVITPTNTLAAGQELYRLLCLSCHAIDGPIRNIKPLTAPFTPNGLAVFLSGMHRLYPSMPPFPGSDDERRALATYIAYGLNGRQNLPEVHIAPQTEISMPSFTPEDDDYLLLAWSTEGVHMVTDREHLMLLLPPGNGLRAQLIKRGETPEVITQAIRMEYSFTADKTIHGTLQPRDPAFVAENIPLLPYHNGKVNPYPVATIKAWSTQDKRLLASTKVVMPISTELGCASCHGGTWRVNNRMGLMEATVQNILATHDRLSNTDLVKRAKKQTVQCSSCHPDSRLHAKGDPQRMHLSAAIHGFHAAFLDNQDGSTCAFCHPSSPTGATRCLRGLHDALGLDCTNCHGSMADHALSLLKREQQNGKAQAKMLMQHLHPQGVESLTEIQPRTPWVHQPDCLTCHEEYQAPETDIGSNVWTTTNEELYKNRTDDSGRLFCSTCHSSAHALYPGDNPYGSQLDIIQPLQYQGNGLPLGSNHNCKLCHTVEMEDEMHHPNSLREFRNE